MPTPRGGRRFTARARGVRSLDAAGRRRRIGGAGPAERALFFSCDKALPAAKFAGTVRLENLDPPNSFPGVLYDLSQDLAERRNLYGERRDVVRRLKALLDKYKREGRSTPGPTQRSGAVAFLD